MTASYTTGTKDPTLDCGHPVSPHLECTTGYGKYDGKLYCYDCCLEMDKTVMAEATNIIVYPDSKGKTVGNWPGGGLGRVTLSYPIRHNWWACPKLQYYRIRAWDGSEWYGKGSGNGMALRIHKAKVKRN